MHEDTQYQEPPDLAFIASMTEDEKEAALCYLAGWTPDGMQYAIKRIEDRRARNA